MDEDYQVHEGRMIKLAEQSARNQRLMAYGSAFLSGGAGIRVYDSIASGEIKRGIAWGTIAILGLLTSYILNRRANKSEQEVKERQIVMWLKRQQELSELEKD